MIQQRFSYKIQYIPKVKLFCRGQTGMDAIKTKKLNKTYVSGHFWSRKRSVALVNVDLAIKEKQVFGLLGLNGAGKTTLMKILLGLVSPTSGKALVLGRDIREASNRKYIAYLPEMPYFPRYLTPREILTFYGRLYELSNSESKTRAAEALQTVGLYKRADSKLREFSKGMLQRVGIASLLLNDSKLFFLDEPTYGLDPLAAKEMRDIILGLKKKGKTILLNSHQINEVHRLCDRIGILHDGRLITDLPVSKVKGNMEDFFIRTVKKL